MDNNLPPEFEALAALVDQQPLRVREAFHFCLDVAMGGGWQGEATQHRPIPLVDMLLVLDSP